MATMVGFAHYVCFHRRVDVVFLGANAFVCAIRYLALTENV